MADSSSGSEKKKKYSKIKWGSTIVAGVSFAVNTVLNFMGKGVTIPQIIAFFNSWPVVYLGIGLCLAYTITVCFSERQKTIRKANDVKNYKKNLDEEVTKREKAEQQLEEEHQKNRELVIKAEKLEAKKECLEKENESLKKNNERLEEMNKRLSENANRTGGNGGTNLVQFNGRKGSDT